LELLCGIPNFLAEATVGMAQKGALCVGGSQLRTFLLRSGWWWIGIPIIVTVVVVRIVLIPESTLIL
jgi:hypothetical protein